MVLRGVSSQVADARRGGVFEWVESVVGRTRRQHVAADDVTVFVDADHGEAGGRAT